MDASSIITQVPQSANAAGDNASSSSAKQADDDANHASSAAAANHNDAAAASATTSVEVPAAESQQQSKGKGSKSKSEKGSKKKGSSGFLYSLLCCCLGKKRGGSAEKESGSSSSSYGGNGSATAADGADRGGGAGGVSATPAGAKAHGGKPLLSELRPEDANKKCIVIDLDETLVHSSFKPINNADFIVPVEIDGAIHQVYVLKRPHVDEFLVRVGELYECVLFTASLAKYADPVTDLLDKWDVFRYRLFRESCVMYKSNYVKDLSRLGRELHNILIVDNSPASYIFHPDNAVPVASWFDDMDDRELLDLIPFLEKLASVDDIYSLLQKGHKSNGGGEVHAQAHAAAASSATSSSATAAAGGNPIASVAR